MVLISCFGLAGQELPCHNPQKFISIFEKAKEANLKLIPHCGEEFEKTDEGIATAIENVEWCVNQECTRIGHAVVLGYKAEYLSEATEQKQKELIAKIKTQNIIIESMPYSNICIQSTGVTTSLNHLQPLLDASCEIVLGSDDAACWSKSIVECMNEQRNMFAFNYGLDELKRICFYSIRSFAESASEDKDKLYARIIEARKAHEVPCIDMHAHFAASLCNIDKIFEEKSEKTKKKGIAQKILKSPKRVKRIQSSDGFAREGGSQWPSLIEFRCETYKHQLGIILSDGVSYLADKLLYMVSDYTQGQVYGVALQMFLPPDLNLSWLLFYGAQMSAVREKVKNLMNEGVV